MKIINYIKNFFKQLLKEIKEERKYLNDYTQNQLRDLNIKPFENSLNRNKNLNKNLRKNSFTKDQMIIASYLTIYGNESFGLTNSEIAFTIGRNNKSLSNKIYRLRKIINGENIIPSIQEENVINYLVNYEKDELFEICQDIIWKYCKQPPVTF